MKLIFVFILLSFSLSYKLLQTQPVKLLQTNMPFTADTRYQMENSYKKLQKKMKKNGWNRVYSEDKPEDIYFMHPNYPGIRFECHQMLLSDGTVLSFPMVGHNDDELGLACRFDVKSNQRYCGIVANNWTSYWDNRKGKRRTRYLTYLRGREKKREQILEEEARANKNMKST